MPAIFRTKPDYRSLAARMDQLDEQIEALQALRKEFYSELRDNHGRIVADAFKAAIKFRRMDAEMRARTEKVSTETSRILGIISDPRAPRATPARENIREFPPAGEREAEQTSAAEGAPPDREHHSPERTKSDGRDGSGADLGGDLDIQPSPSAELHEQRATRPRDSFAGLPGRESVSTGGEPGGADATGGHTAKPSPRAVTLQARPAVTPLAALDPEAWRARLRPHCRDPKNCGGQLRKHCPGCTRAAGLVEAETAA